MDERLRVWRWGRQGLDGSLAGVRAHAVLERTGWMRSAGGASPYLALFARSGASRAAVDAEVAKLAIHELPSARGCTYVVPAADFGLALRAGAGHGDAATLAMAKKHLGVTDAEIAKLCDKILVAVAKTAREPRELKDELGDAVRHLGAEGKKRGTTTTLPFALALLQTSGRIRRVPTDGRLDQQRYRYVAWAPPPVCTLSDAEVAVELARRFFRWAGPATVAQLAWWAGLGAKSARAAVAALGLVPFADGDERVVAAEDLAAIRATRLPREPSVTLVPVLDNLSHTRRDVLGLLEAEDAKVKLHDGQGARPGASLVDLPHHAIVDRGRIIGFWEYDVTADDGHGAIAWSTFASTGAAARAATRQAVARTEAFVREQLGDARSFSLDAPETRGARLAAVQKYDR